MSHAEVKERSAKVIAELKDVLSLIRMVREGDNQVPVRSREDVQ